MNALDGIGDGAKRDLAALNQARLMQMARAGNFGPWHVSQLFVGTRGTDRARSMLHFDHNDNLFLQVSGVKTFKLYEPTEAGHLYAYPTYHTMDRKAQVDLSRAHEAEHASMFPRFARARSVEVRVGPGDLLFLPACAPPQASNHQTATYATLEPTGQSTDFW